MSIYKSAIEKPVTTAGHRHRYIQFPEAAD